MSQSAEVIVEWFIEHIDEVFEKHPELKKKLYEKLKGEIEEKVVTREEIKQILIELKELREDFNRLSAEMKELREELKELREDFNRLSAEMKELREDFNRLSTRLELRLEALGARWGILSERAFREGMKYIIEKFFGGRVGRWEYYDEKGYVYGVPSVVDVDVLIKDSEHILVEVKSRIDRPDVAVFKKKAELYEKVEGVKARLVMISPFVTDPAVDLATKLDIKIIKGIPGY